MKTGWVEIGGPCPKVLRNHPMKRLKTISEHSQTAVLKLAGYHPEAEITNLEVAPMGGDVWRIRGEAINRHVTLAAALRKGESVKKVSG